MDDEGSNAPRFQPTIRCGSDSSITFLFAFTDAVTGLPVALRNFFVTGVDLDGSSGYREFHELRGFSEYTLDSGTLLTVDARGDGYNQFLGRGDSLGGISFDDTASYIARYEAAVSQIRFRLGTSGNTGSTNRQFSLALGAAAGAFSNPEVSSAPLPVLSTAAALVTARFQVTATFNEPVEGLLESEIAVDNGAVDSGSLNSDAPGLEWTFDVVPGGDGAVLVQIPESVATSLATGLANANSNVLRVTVDATSPDTGFDTRPSDPTSTPVGAFDFNSDEAGVTYECRVYAEGAVAPSFGACDEAFETASLADGRYTLDVRARDGAGNVDATPATYAWTVDATSPDTGFDVVEPSPTDDPSADFDFGTTGDDGDVTYACRYGAPPLTGAFEPCSEVFTTAELGPGVHVIEVVATDAAGNSDSTPASYTW